MLKNGLAGSLFAFFSPPSCEHTVMLEVALGGMTKAEGSRMMAVELFDSTPFLMEWPSTFQPLGSRSSPLLLKRKSPARV